MLIITKQLLPNTSIDIDYDNTIIPCEKYDSRYTYTKEKGYFPGVMFSGEKVLWVENRDGNANVKLNQAQTLNNGFECLKAKNITINRFRADCGSFSKEIIETLLENVKHFYIRAQNSQEHHHQVSQCENWKPIELNFKKIEVTSIKFTSFFAEKIYGW